ncbi:MAG: tRNA preQ1(34) S-adenosylmethionine ribosyltransferase-isomerase QueA, partial [Planctomycetia bacterium]
HQVRDLPTLLRPRDLLVVNDTRVVAARLVGRRMRTGGRGEGLFLRVDSARNAWQILAQTRGRPEPGERIMLVAPDGTDGLPLLLVGRGEGGTWLAVPEGANAAKPPEEILARVGRVPLPGYIRGGAAEPGDRDRYQTVYARTAGSAAAPTAGLHFDDGLLEALAARGVDRATVTLHVGLDTFRPITAERVDDHPMHTEWCVCPEETVAAVESARAAGGRVVAVGTTTVRTLETAARDGRLAAAGGPTDLFIRPGHRFRAVDCLLTNFHMPRTTLMLLVSAFTGRDLVMHAYEEAVREGYRFLSYGDAMLVV